MANNSLKEEINNNSDITVMNEVTSQIQKTTTQHKIFKLPIEIEDYKLFVIQKQILILEEYLQTQRENKYAKRIEPFEKQATSFLVTINNIPNFFDKSDNKTGKLLVIFIENYSLERPGSYM